MPVCVKHFFPLQECHRAIPYEDFFFCVDEVLICGDVLSLPCGIGHFLVYDLSEVGSEGAPFDLDVLQHFAERHSFFRLPYDLPYTLTGALRAYAENAV